ncbi:MAG: hypothetical protein NT031_19210, partial [Planctomycetota bacterium]|nr:hypothetical protein [Planctomycetota bacterium]
LAAGKTPDDLPVALWRSPDFPPGVEAAVRKGGLHDLNGTYGNEHAGDPVEYDHLRLVFGDETVVDITVFNRGIALPSADDPKVQRIHRVLCKLKTAQMAVPGVFTPGQRAGTDPRLPVPPGGKFTYRDQANVLTLLAFRNGPIEDLHAGQSSPLLEDPGLSRITDEEMKTLMIAASTKLAELLALRDSDPDAFAQVLAVNWRQVRNWER